MNTGTKQVGTRNTPILVDNNIMLQIVFITSNTNMEFLYDS